MIHHPITGGAVRLASAILAHDAAISRADRVIACCDRLEATACRTDAILADYRRIGSDLTDTPEEI